MGTEFVLLVSYGKQILAKFWFVGIVKKQMVALNKINLKTNK